MITQTPPMPALPRRSDLGPDPEALAGRFDRLMEVERRARRAPVRMSEHRVRAGGSRDVRGRQVLTRRDAA